MSTNPKPLQIKQVGDHTTKRQTVWRGDHRACSHASKVCIALQAWRLNGDSALVPNYADRPLSQRHVSIAHFADGSAMPAWKAKGWVEASEAEGVRPSEQVIRWHRDRESESLEKAAGIQRATYGDKKQILADFFAAFDAANDYAPPKPKLKKPTRDQENNS